MQAPVFSIITPTYNRAYVLWRTILSARAQIFPDWEMLIVDDGSTDDTARLVAEFQDDPRIRYLPGENGGPWTARNRGLAAARGDIIAYLDSDDQLVPHCLGTALDYFRRAPGKKFAICNHSRRMEYRDDRHQRLAFLEDDNGQIGAITLQDFYDWRVKTTSSGLFHRRAPFAGKVEWRNTVMIEDLEFVMQLAVLDPDGFMHIPVSLVYYIQTYGAKAGMCSDATYDSYAQAFGMIYELHKSDPLMKNPDVYLDRVKKYSDLHQKVLRGEERPNVYKYFPELWDKDKASR